MQTLGASLCWVAAGEVEAELSFRSDLAQQYDNVHGGIVPAILDAAFNYAVLSLSGFEYAVVKVEYKVNFVPRRRANGSWRKARWFAPVEVLLSVNGM